MAPPSTMKAILTAGVAGIELAEIDVPQPGPGEVLVKVVAAAQNPTDWKTVAARPTNGNISGCDFSGVVEELGPEVPDNLKVGDRVASVVHGGAYKNGAFAEYVVANANLLLRVPSSWSFEQAAQLGIAGFTACLCLQYAQNLPTPLEPASTPTDILIWGGSSAVGQYVVQFAHLAGLRVIATASPCNFKLVESLGANLVFSYSDAETPQKIKEATGGKLKHVVDCISEGTTPELIAQSVGDEGGIVSTLLPYEAKREDIKNTLVLTYEIFGKAFTIPFPVPAKPEIHEFAVKAAKLLTEVLASGNIKPSPVKLMPKGLASVKDGFAFMKDGKVSGEKIVYRITDTPESL